MNLNKIINMEDNLPKIKKDLGLTPTNKYISSVKAKIELGVYGGLNIICVFLAILGIYSKYNIDFFKLEYNLIAENGAAHTIYKVPKLIEFFSSNNVIILTIILVLFLTIIMFMKFKKLKKIQEK